MRQLGRTGVGTVDGDLQGAVVRERNAVVAIAQVKAEVLLSAVVEIGREAQVDGDWGGAIGLEDRLGWAMSPMRVTLSVLSQRGASSGCARAGILMRGMRTVGAMEKFALEGKSQCCGKYVVGRVAGEDEDLRVGVGGVGAHGDGWAGDRGHLERGRKGGGALADDDGIARRNGADGDGKAYGARVREHAKPGGDDSGSLQAFERGLGQEDDRDDGAEIDLGS